MKYVNVDGKRRLVSRAKGSLKPSEASDFTIIEEVEKYENRGMGGGLVVTIHKGVMSGKEAFVLSVVGWGFDDVDEDYTFFDDFGKAKYAFDIATGKVKYKSPDRVLVMKYKDGRPDKRMSGTEHRGYLSQTRYYGELMVPFFDGEKLALDGVKDELTDMLTEDEYGVDDLIGTRWEKYLIKMGDNERLVVLDSASEKPETHPKEISLAPHQCWETGITYYELRSRVPKHIFSRLAPWYHNEEIEEEGEWKGWVVGNMAVLEELKNEGWSVSYGMATWKI